MRAVVFDAHGDSDRLHLAELPDPVPRAGEVRVRVRAVALNRLDLWVRIGWKGLDLPKPHVLGSDVAGVVDVVGAEVVGISPGDEVVLGPGLGCGRCGECLRGRDNYCGQYHILGETVRGGYADLVVVPARNIFKKPATLSFVEAACLPLVFTTAWGMLVERTGLRAGEWVLVHAAGSGVGSAAIQVAKLLGATVIATASTDEKLARAAALGADHTINYAHEDFARRVREMTDKRGVDVVFEHTGGDTFDGSLRALAVGGRLVTCGATSRPQAELDIRRLFARQLTIYGHTMGSLAAMLPTLEHAATGRFKPVLDRTMPLTEARAAHEVLAHRAQFGKVVLVP
ncbi:MAG: zinc-binding dehydrogenase [Deltaproteobacteria bacterium]|nr:zinc-binding dehydrogenase [Deltaproteobacteria bacterium]